MQAAGGIYLTLIALPGYFLAIALIDIMGRWWMQVMGFFVSMIIFIILGAAFYPLINNAGASVDTSPVTRGLRMCKFYCVHAAQVVPSSSCTACRTSSPTSAPTPPPSSSLWSPSPRA
jgi:hypothetical protein